MTVFNSYMNLIIYYISTKNGHHYSQHSCAAQAQNIKKKFCRVTLFNNANLSHPEGYFTPASKSIKLMIKSHRLQQAIIYSTHHDLRKFFPPDQFYYHHASNTKLSAYEKSRSKAFIKFDIYTVEGVFLNLKKNVP